MEHRATRAKYCKTTIDATAGHMYVLDQFRLEWKHVFKPQKDALGWKKTKGKKIAEDFSGKRINRW